MINYSVLSEDALLDMADEDYDEDLYGGPGQPSHPEHIAGALAELERRSGVRR